MIRVSCTYTYNVLIYVGRMTANPESAPKIDWAFYKKNIPVAGLVEKFQKDYESFTVPYPPDNYTSQIEAEEKEIVIAISGYSLFRFKSVYLFNLD